MRRYPEGANGQMGDRYTVIRHRVSRDGAGRGAARRRSPDERPDTSRPTTSTARSPASSNNSAPCSDHFPPLAAQNNARELIRPTPRGGRRGGLPAEVRTLTLEDVQSYWQRYYKPRNAIVALAGAVDPATARQAITAHFARLAPGENVLAPGEPEKPKYGVVRELTVKSRIPQRPAHGLSRLRRSSTGQYSRMLHSWC